MSISSEILHLTPGRLLKMIFIHIPKTAGQSIIYASKVKPIRGRRHARLRDLSDEESNSGDIFTCVRNPYDRAVSTYYYLKDLHKDSPFSPINQVEDASSFWNHVYANKEIMMSHPVLCYFRPQISFINEADGMGVSSKITRMFRYESINEDWQSFADIHNFLPIEHKNESVLRSHGDWSEELTDECVSNINEMYSDDFTYLEYEKVN